MQKIKVYATAKTKEVRVVCKDVLDHYDSLRNVVMATSGIEYYNLIVKSIEQGQVIFVRDSDTIHKSVIFLRDGNKFVIYWQ